jgi:hypothetical protein
LLAGGWSPPSALTPDDVETGILLEDFHRPDHARFVGWMADKAFDDHYFAFAAESSASQRALMRPTRSGR